MGKIRAILFDMDGVLLDTESVCKVCWARAAEEYNLSNINEIFLQCVGRSRADTTLLLQKYLPGPEEASAFRERTSLLFDDVWREQGLQKMPYVDECLKDLKKAGFRMAVASSTRKVRVFPQLKDAGIFDYFETFTTGDMVASSKPDPEIYLKAASSLGLSPCECVAIEDSPNGVRAAFNAGMKCIMVPDLISPDDEMKSKAWKIFKNLKETAEFLTLGDSE